MNFSAPKRQIFLTGAPGSGKTTLVRKVCQELKSRTILLKGFYTEELRASGSRVGFDVVSVNGERKPLARVGENTKNIHLPKVGKYEVNIPSFESLALPALTSRDIFQGVFVVDEIGKMELYSKSFEIAIQNLIMTKSVIFGTIPLLDGRSHQLVKSLHTSPSAKVITVNADNRDSLTSEILQCLLSALSE